MAVFINNKCIKSTLAARIGLHAFAILSGFLLTLLPAAEAHAGFLEDIFGISEDQSNITTIATNVVTSSEMLPGLITACSYLLALLFGITGVLKLKDHVESPNQTPLRISLTRFIIGGALLGLPMIYEVMRNAITGNGGVVTFDAGVFTLADSWSNVLGMFGGLAGSVSSDFNTLLASIMSSIEGLPGVITAMGYLLGLLFGVLGLLKLKDHIENPDQTRMKEGVIRLLIGGALFALPNVFEVLQNTIIGDAGTYDFGTVAGILAFITDLGDLVSGAAVCNPVEIAAASIAASDNTVGSLLCSISFHAGAFPAFLTALAYLFGLVMGFWGVLKVQDHVLNPQQTTIWEGLSRFIAAGCFFTLPAIVDVMKTTVAPVTITDGVGSVFSIFTNIDDVFTGIVSAIPGLGGILGGLFGGGSGATGAGAACQGLDGALACFMSDVSGPFTAVVNLFAVVGGTILIMIGISRLIKSSQDGARAPGGIGTIMTFLTGGILISYNEILGSFTSSVFGGSGGMRFPTLAYSKGLSGDEVAHAQIVIGAILQFMVIVGVISFVRGIFLVRGVAEGNQQASLMAAVTHLVGGALAVNLGSLVNAVQETLGITDFGITFGSGP